MLGASPARGQYRIGDAAMDEHGASVRTPRPTPAPAETGVSTRDARSAPGRSAPAPGALARSAPLDLCEAGPVEAVASRVMERIEVDGLHIAYERLGTGPSARAPPRLCGRRAHSRGDGNSTGSPTSSRSSRGMPQGAGRSTDPPEGFGLDGYADCLARFMDELGLDGACVAGLSFGGILALALQRRPPPSRAP